MSKRQPYGPITTATSRTTKRAVVVASLLDLLDDVTAQPFTAPPPANRCHYCGDAAPAVACERHADLPYLDPRYDPALRLRAIEDVPPMRNELREAVREEHAA